MSHWIAWLRVRLAEVWYVLRHDPTGFTEALSGAALLVLRALLLLVAPQGVLPLDVQFRLAPINEREWAAYILTLGLLQVVFAGSKRHLVIRLWIKVFILLGFTTVAVAYWLEGLVFSGGMLAFSSMVAFYFGLFLRIMRDLRKGAPRSC
jgi:hypothetical protein